ncbi:MAG: cold shock and DUF1294 domain-containing protein [Gammaproteobacteria bacterium]|nr:cold shock and DUF1294 domain-containing protein [Gammaproteobacteria bacterium]
MRHEGVVKTWNDERGFGFITPLAGGAEVFLHIKALPRGSRRPQAQDRISYELEHSAQGRKRARHARLSSVGPGRRSAPVRVSASAHSTALVPVLAFAALAVVVAVLWGIPAWLPLLYLLASALSFLFYMADKSAARRGTWRTAESTLHLLALLGGWPGAALAQQYLRHKSAKASFRRVFWLTVAINVGAFIVLCTPIGKAHLAPWLATLSGSHLH